MYLSKQTFHGDMLAWKKLLGEEKGGEIASQPEIWTSLIWQRLLTFNEISII